MVLAEYDSQKVKLLINEWLYYILIDRLKYPEKNISHVKLPSKLEHFLFVKSKPYLYWFIVLKSYMCLRAHTTRKYMIGSTYLTENGELGINLLNKYDNFKNFRDIYLRMKSIHSIPDFICRLQMNVNPKNIKRIKYLKSLNFKLLKKDINQDIYINNV